MSPLKIKLLLDMHCLVRPLAGVPQEQAFAPAMRDALEYFTLAGFVQSGVTLYELRAGQLPARAYLTAKGEALVAHIKAAADNFTKEVSQ